MDATLAPKGTVVERACQMVKLAPAEKYKKILTDVLENVQILDSAADYWSHLSMFEAKVNIQVKMASRVAMYWQPLSILFKCELQRQCLSLETVAQSISWRLFMALVETSIKAPTIKDMAREQLRKWSQKSQESTEATVNQLTLIHPGGGG